MTENKEKTTSPAISGKKNPFLPCVIMAILCFVVGIVWSHLDPSCDLSDWQLAAVRWILGILCFFVCGEALFISIRNHGLGKNENFEFYTIKLFSFYIGPIIGFVVFLLGKAAYWMTQNLNKAWYEVKDWLSASFDEILIIGVVLIALIFVVIRNRKRTEQKFGRNRVI